MRVAAFLATLFLSASPSTCRFCRSHCRGRPSAASVTTDLLKRVLRSLFTRRSVRCAMMMFVLCLVNCATNSQPLLSRGGFASSSKRAGCHGEVQSTMDRPNDTKTNWPHPKARPPEPLAAGRSGNSWGIFAGPALSLFGWEQT